MDSTKYTYNGKLWEASSTVSDKDTFFHAAFGVKTKDDNTYLDKRVKFRRMRWATFLTYFENEAMPPRLADILSKCLRASDKYERASVEDPDQFNDYVSDITKVEHDVTTEEIAVLASLENIKVVLFKDKESEPPTIIDPDVEILGSYPSREKHKGEAVLCLKGNIFTRMNPIEDPEPKSNKSEAKVVEVVKGAKPKGLVKYKKGGSAGSEGVQFQVGLLTVFFLNALQKLKDWKLSTENKAAGKFDDAVLEWPEGATLLQAKHKQSRTKKITFEELISANSKNGDFSLPKYFLSYEEIKKTFKLRDVIICTNASVDGKAMKFLKTQKVPPESMLHYENCDCEFYTFKDEILPCLKENVKSYYEKNSKNKGVDVSVITEENIKNFLGHLRLYSNYPPGNDVCKVTEQLLSRMKRLQNLHGQISPLEIHTKILDWFQEEDGVYLTELYAKAIFSEIGTDKHWQRLEKYNVFFHTDDLNFQKSKKMVHVTVEGAYLLQEIKIFRALQDKTKILFVNPDDGAVKQKQVLEAFGLPQYTILVLVWSKITEESVMEEVSCKLREILDKYGYKKVVLVADCNNKIPHFVGLSPHNYDVISDSITFEDLSEDSQERLLKKENIVFQGKDVSLEELLAKPTTEDYGKFLDSEVLEKLVRDEKINVGAPPLGLDEESTRFYVKRHFKIMKNRNGGGRFAKRNEIFHEEWICEMNEKVMLISDVAGMGKSTVLASLAATVKKKYPHLWVIRIDLNGYTKVLKDFLEKHRKTINVLDLLNSKYSTKLTNHLERSTFSMNAKVVLMLDGFDEISPDYTQLVLNLLGLCRKQRNFAKIFVTTRPHVARELKGTLKVEPFTLEPFTEQNQIHFLTNYWMNNLKVSDTKRDVCERYAQALIDKLSFWVQLFHLETNDFAALPLHVRMLAEIFQEKDRFVMPESWEGCKEYLVADADEPKLPENMDVARLYKMFIEKKRSVFIEKGNPTGNTAARQALNEQFEECLVYHRNLALELILNKTNLELFSCYQQTCNVLCSVVKFL